MAVTSSSRVVAVPKPQPSVLSQWHAVVFYLVLVFGDRLQNPYEYKLYYYNKLEQTAIAQIYAVGTLGGCFADLWGRSIAKRVGWKLSAPLLLALLMQSCLMKKTDHLETLMISKVLAKMCVLTLFPLALGQFSARTRPSDVAIMISIGFIGIVAGVTGSLLCDVIYFDCFIMFRIATYVLGLLFLFHWLAPPSQPIKDLLEPYRSDRIVTLAVLSSEAALWCCSTVVEAFWAPLVNPSNMDVGLLYALYCFFHVFGGCFFRVTRMIQATPRYTLTLSCLLAAVGMFFAAAAMPVYPDSVLVIVMAMLAFHFSLGLWGAALRKLRNCAMLSPRYEAYARCAGRLVGAAMLTVKKEFDTQYLCGVFTLCCLFVLLSLMPVQSLARWKQKSRVIQTEIDTQEQPPREEQQHQQQQHEDVVVHNGYSLVSVAATWCAGAILGTLAGVLGFLFVATVATGSLFPSKQRQGPPPPERDDGSVCYSPDCLATAAYLHEKLNPLVEPCRNFPDYVCGRFRGPSSVMEQVLAVHVELSYKYGVSGLLRIQPNVARSLSVELDHEALMASAERVENVTISYLLLLASIAEVKYDVTLLLQWNTLHQSMEQAVAHAWIVSAQSVRAASQAFKQVKDLQFAGVSPNAFADAIEASTPYRREASVYEGRRVVPLLESVWQAFTDIDDLLVWTGWYVLDALAPFVDTLAAKLKSDDKLSFGTSCVTMVSHVMAPAVAALIRLSQVTDKARDQIATMTDVIATCLKGRTTWISPFATPPRLLVGFPPYADSVERLDAFYANFPKSSQNFFADWIAAADERARRLSPEQEHVDVFRMDVDVAADGTVVVPASLFALPFFATGGPPALNSILPSACLPGSGGDLEGGVLESLLAYSCIGGALAALNGTHEQRLPQYAGLTPETIMYTVGCLKDCVPQLGGQGRCMASSQRLRGFEDAFSCDSKGQKGATCTFG
ncbi:hypothetical protein HPB52_016371 [Rhipicephalus sanguineus]|uniref:Uncharacterized protein n=1 Tax=Rhipicephalus sanguineus TaxID=34632 RepID=A0A9D4SP48_RHISA|nr:hypothetical protein HPB52_016371 [Rhipicephalus sanguineus]